MILLDFSGAMFAGIMIDLKSNYGTKTDIDYLRHLILNMIRGYNSKFKDDYGELVICLDSHSGSLWRTKIFPYYKFARKKTRLDSGIDWNTVFSDVNQIVDEIRTYLPFRTIMVDGLEADDVIALLTIHAPELSNDKNLLIISNDKDYAQLHKYRYVKQYRPISGNIVKEKNPDILLTELIVRGDKSDGVPNIFSDDDTFAVQDKRQKPVTTKFLREFFNSGVSCLTEEQMTNYERNRKLISFDEIPEEYHNIVMEMYRSGKDHNPSRMSLFEYFAQKRLKNLVQYIDDFFVNK